MKAENWIPVSEFRFHLVIREFVFVVRVRSFGILDHVFTDTSPRIRSDLLEQPAFRVQQTAYPPVAQYWNVGWPGQAGG